MAASGIPPPALLPLPKRPPPTSMPTKVDITAFEFTEPVKKIKSPEDIARWEDSEAYRDILGFITAMNAAIKSQARSDASASSDAVQRVVTLLEILHKWVGDIPAEEQPSRFGNKAYRTWYTRVQDQCEIQLQSHLGDEMLPAIKELKVYFLDSFGNATRIDYGTGHELAFVAFLCCLFKLGFFEEKDAVNVVFRVFQKYLELCRVLQLTYRMEPAGSHGAWSLDDFQFMCFLWGAAQLINHNKIQPDTALYAENYNRFAFDYLYLEALQHINRVKTGPFHEHSSQLWNISGVPMWSKVNTGLIKMYKVEVLGKFPIMQHFYFGSLLSFEAVR